MMRRFRVAGRCRSACIALVGLALVGFTVGHAAAVVAASATPSVVAASPRPVAARFYGSMGGRRLNQPIVGMAATASGKGYWLVASDGGIFSFGDARFYGSMGGVRLNRPVVGMAATRTGKGYWLVASDGGIFSFGDARFYGSMGGIQLNRPIVGMAVSMPGRSPLCAARGCAGKGYWLAASDGGIFSFGDARFIGSTASIPLSRPVVGIAAFYNGEGYALVTAGGKVYWATIGTGSPTITQFGIVPDFETYPSCTDPNDPTPTFGGDRQVSTSSVQIVGIVDHREGESPIPGSEFWLASTSGRADVPIAAVPDYIIRYDNGSTCGPAQITTNLGMFSSYQRSLNALPPLHDVVGYATTSNATGLWVVAADGGVFVPRCAEPPCDV